MPTLGTLTSNQQIQTQGSNALTPGATVTVNVDNNYNLFTWTAGEAETVISTGSQNAGRKITLLVTCDATPRTLTFGSGFIASATYVLTASKVHTIHFISNGTAFYEQSRLAMA